MQITFYDKNMFETAVADNVLMNAIKIKKASLTSLFEEATHQVEFEFSKEFGEWWGIKENGYLAFRFKGDFFRFSIVKFKEDAKTNTITIVGDYFNLEMLNENCIAYEKQPARTIVQHFNAMEILPYANFEIGVNELANSTRVLTYTGDEVKYKRLISIINNFGGECEFEIKQKANGQFDKLILNIYKANDGVNYQGVGRNRRDLEITIDNSNNVSRMVDSTEIKTSIEPIGKDGLRLGNRGTTWKNEDGQVEFYQKNNRIYAPLAADEMQRVLDSDKFLLWKQSIDTDNVAKLESEGLKWLKNVCYAKENIEVSGSFDVRVGDTVILNHKGIGKYGILGSLRVTKIVWDLLTETNEVTFSNFKRLASKISAQGLALQESIETPASYDIQFNTTGGTVFKNNTGASNVSFNFSKNGAKTAVLGARWYKGTQLLSNGLEVMIKPDKLVDDKLVLRLEVDVTDSITYSKELTFINVNDGVKGDQGNGITSTMVTYQSGTSGTTAPTGTWVSTPPSVPQGQYLWTRTIFTYSDTTNKTVYSVARQGTDGAKGTDGIAGKDGVGIISTIITYGLSSNDSTQPTSWTSSVPTLVKGQYLWTKTVWTYTDGKTETGYTKTYIAKDGNTGSDGIAGKDGVGISTTTITYQGSTSGTVTPTGTWTSSVPSVPSGQYLWTKTVWTYTDGKTETGYSVAKMGETGAQGNGITSTMVTYQSGTSGTTAPTGTWVSTPPSVPQGQYLWTRTIFTYSDTTNKTVYSVARQGTDGAKGTDGIAGKDGVGIISTIITYGLSSNDSTQPTSWTSSVPTLVKGQYLWTKTVWTYTDGKTETGYTKTYIAKDGNTGSDGIAGKDGVGISTTTITYQGSTSGTVTPTGTWTSSVPSVPSGQYLWTKTVWTYTDGKTETGYSVAKMGETGAQGNGITSTMVTYQSGTSGTTAPTGTWVSTPPSVPQGQYLWTRTIFTYSDTTNKTVYSVARQGTDGAKGTDGIAGKDGVGIISTIITYGLSSNDSTQPTSWTSSVPTLVKGQYLWTKTVWTYTDGKTETGYTKTYIAKDGNTGSDGIAGKDGVGISTTTITYQGSTSGTVTPTGTWTSSVPSVPSGQYLWTKTVWTYTDGKTETGYSVAKMGETGAQGNGITSTMVTYQSGTSGTTAPTGTWVSTPPSVPQGQYLWTRTIFTYSDTTNKTVYSVARQGTDGAKGTDGIAGKDGVGIISTIITYGLSSNDSTQPTSWTSSVPTLVKGQYLWTKTVWTYTDGKTETGYTKTYIAKDGNTGSDGIAGKDGVGISTTTITYQGSTSGTVTPTGTWTSSVPSVPSGQYLWTKTVWTYTDGKTETGYSVAKMGETGAQGVKGKDGISITNTVTTNALATSGTTAPTSGWSATMPTLIKGQFLWTKIELTLSDSTTQTSYFVNYIPNDGVNGQTPVVHTAYANSQNGAVDFSITDSTNRRFIGQYVDYSTTNSTDYTKYKWVDMTGSVQVGGVNLIKNTAMTSGAFRYNHVNKAGEGGLRIDAVLGLTETLSQPNQYTLTLRARGMSDRNIILYQISPLGNSTINFINNTDLTEDFKTFSITFTPTKANLTDLWIYTYYSSTAYSSWFEIEPKSLKLEKGNIPTSWSHAPEDIDAKIDTKADQLYTQQQILALEEKTTLERENAIAEAMQNTISEVEQKWQLWYDTNTKDEKQQVANDIASLMQRTAELDYKLGDASAKFSFINNETIIGEDGVAIGDKAGKAKLFMSGDSISFLTNGVAQMTLTGDTLSIKNGLFTERIQIGNFVEEVYDKNPLYNVIRSIKNS